MTNEEIKQGFNEAIESGKLTADQVAKAELLREWFTNPEFKAKLQQFTYERREA